MNDEVLGYVTREEMNLILFLPEAEANELEKSILERNEKIC